MAFMARPVSYDEKTIQTLDALAHIRKRTGMYIGRIGDGSHPQDGIYVLLKEVVDNSIDEFIMGHGTRVNIQLSGNEVRVRDFGRGIPLGKVVECVSQINTGGKYNDAVFQFSVGLNGVGTKAVNALSREFEVISYREGKFKRARFCRGVLQEENSGTAKQEPNGTFVRFVPDEQIFGSYAFRDEFIASRLRYYAFLNSGLTIYCNDVPYHAQNGLNDLLLHEMGDETPLYPVIYVRAERIEFAFTHTSSYGEKYFSFVNGQYTNDGGTHQSAFREGVLKGVSEVYGRSFAGEDVREGIVGAVAVKVQDPVFESQTKNKLGSTEVRGPIVAQVKEQVELWLHKHSEAKEALLDKVRSNERIRKELASVKKEARERARKVAVRIPKLTDCKVHFGELKERRRLESSIFLTEGDSAGGAMVPSRDVYTQAIFTLKGKPLNCFGLSRDAIYKNEELYNIMRALGIEDSLDGLRYNKVIIATDADVDGMHIRNLLLTYFLRFFEDLVARGHVYILETPLFRVRNKKESRYCYSEAERDRAMAALPHCEVTRFKGLGEISPSEFGQFIQPKTMRAAAVQLGSSGQTLRALSFYMGKNTPERRNFIVDHLIDDIGV